VSGSGGRYGGAERGERGGRQLPWPPPLGSDLQALAAELAEGIDAVAQDGGALALIELTPAGAAAATQLCERLAAHWQAGGRRCLVVDGHPTAPFFSVLFAGSPEGFTEILHYGLSPAAAALERPHCAGLWIPAGGRWALPLESPDEPHLTLSRLLGEAERVLLLADAEDAEGLLPALRAGCHYRLQLEAVAAPLAAASPALAVATPVAAPAGRRAPAAASVRRRAAGRGPGSRRWWPFLLLPAGALLLLLGLFLITGPWGGGDAPAGRSVERGAGDAFSPLPAPAALPYAAPAAEDDAPAADAPAPQSAGLAPATGLAEPPAAVAPTAERPRGALQRRFEPAGAWARLQGAPGPFFVHLESFRDSVVAAEAAGSQAARRIGVRLAPAAVDGVRWYRLWLGPFAELATAAACRDSLLDRAGEDYCRIVTASP
jgi:hypothetical protein